MRGLLFALQLNILLFVRSKQSRDCKKQGPELSSKSPGASSAHGRLEGRPGTRTGRLGGRLAALLPWAWRSEGAGTALHTPACPACAIWGMRDTRGGSGSCRLRQTPGGCYKGLKVFPQAIFKLCLRTSHGTWSKTVFLSSSPVMSPDLANRHAGCPVKF